MARIPLITDASLSGKLVLIRSDHNVVKKGKIKDPFKIERSRKTIDYVLKNGGYPIIMSHFGRPRNKKTGKMTILPEENAGPVIKYIGDKWGLKAKLVEVDTTNASDAGIEGLPQSVNQTIQDLRDGKIQAIYLPNTRWFRGEENTGEPRDRLARELAGLVGEDGIYVYDAFGSWQPHASTFDVMKHIPSYTGFLVQEEVEKLALVTNPKKPFLAVVAGKKIDTKIGPIRILRGLADYLILGGLPYNALLCAKYGVSINGVGKEELATARQLLKEDQGQDRILFPRYVVESDVEDGREKGGFREIDVTTLKKGQKLNFIYDVAMKSFEDERIREAIEKAGTIFVNAVMGYDKVGYEDGTRALLELMAANTHANQFFGGGDTLGTLQKLTPKFHERALKDDKITLFTGGGTILKSIEEGGPYKLPTIKALIENKARFG